MSDKPQSQVMPFVLMAIGVLATLYFAAEDEFLAAAVGVVVAGIGWVERHETGRFNKHFRDTE